MKTQGSTFILWLAALSFIVGRVQGGAVSPMAPAAAPLHQHSHHCPLWYHYYNTATQNCTCLPDWMVHCDHHGRAYLDFRHLLSYDKSKRVLSRTISMNLQLLPWEYNTTNAGEVLLPKDISKLNDYMCAPLNRKGYMCSKCIQGFGPSMISLYMGDMVCCDCSKGSGWYGVILYLAIEFVPLTIFYLLILVFCIQITSAPMISFIMFNQLIVMAFKSSADSDSPLNQVKFTDSVTMRPISKVFITLYGVFNLDFFHYVVDPFCVSSHLTSLHLALLGYVSAFYPFLLTALTWISFELHDRNFRPIVILWKPFRRCFARLRSAKDDITDVFASFFVLSYTKIMYQTLLTLSTDKIDNYSLAFKPIPRSSYVLNADSSVTVESAKFICIAIFTGLLFCVFNIFPVLLLVLYPFRWFRSALSKCGLKTIAINHFVEKFHHSYRDGLDGGKDMRSFSGVHLLLRIMIIIPVLVLRSIFRMEVWFLRGIVLSITALLVAMCRPYKQMYTNVLDAVLLFYLATFCHLLSSNQDCEVLYFVPVMQALILTPFVIFVLVILIRLIRGVYYRLQRSQKSSLASSAHVSHLVASQPIQPISTCTYGTIND